MQISSRRFGVSDQVRHTMKDRRRWEEDDQSRFCRIWERSIVGCRNVVKKNSQPDHKIFGSLCRSRLCVVVSSPDGPTPKSLRIARSTALVRTEITFPTPSHRGRFFFTPTSTCIVLGRGVKILLVSSNYARTVGIVPKPASFTFSCATAQLLRYCPYLCKVAARGWL